MINNAAEQHPQEKIEDINAARLERTFRTNMFSYFYMAKAALRCLSDGGSIINTSSVTAYRGNPHLIDYSATKGATHSKIARESSCQTWHSRECGRARACCTM